VKERVRVCGVCNCVCGVCDCVCGVCDCVCVNVFVEIIDCNSTSYIAKSTHYSANRLIGIGSLCADMGVIAITE